MGTKGSEWIRWGGGLLVAALVSYFTALGTMNREIATLKATEESHFGEVLRRLDALQADIRELRNR
jgi:hypothetical protein